MPRKTLQGQVEAIERLQGASMRPRPDAAENLVSASAQVLVGSCFNEAAARCRGKPRFGWKNSPR